VLWRRFGSFCAVDREGRLGPTSHAYGVAVARWLARRNGDQLDQVEAISFSTRITCTAVQSPAPRDVGRCRNALPVEARCDGQQGRFPGRL
jgi:hypothetical protein